MRAQVVRHWLRVMRAEGACHVGGWDRCDVTGRGRAKVAAVFMAGPGVDAEQPSGDGAHELKRNRYRDMVLAAMPGTRGEIEARTGISKVCVWTWVKALHEAGECHISGWNRVERGPFTPTYSPGPGKDKPCTLKPYTPAQIAKRFVRRAKEDGSWDVRKARERAKYRADKAAANGDPLVQALFGARAPQQGRQEA